ncbi:MAG: sugar transferase [Erysipelotrichaceae bacterium]|nr:sugar transferase [Erysipelotrichaceae bacterium]
MYVNFLKRIFDLIVSLLVFIFILPIFILIIVIIKIDSKGPVFFTQKRIGKGKKTFYIFKFRSMSIEAPKDSPTHLLKNADSYITKAGEFLRKSSLDELPQLINIIKGDMSIVGPRPALWNQYDLIEERDKYNANDVKPGLTGLAQIKGRDELSIEDKSRYDGEYVKSITFKNDIKIIIGTFLKVISSDGIQEGESNNE